MSTGLAIVIVTSGTPSAVGVSPALALETAVLLARQRAHVVIVGRVVVGANTAVEKALASLEHTSADLSDLTIAESIESPETARLPIDRMFSADCCLIDLEDAARFRFLVDLPVHTWPGARLVGSLSRLSTFPPGVAAEILDRIDSVAGQSTHAIALERAGAGAGVVSAMQAIMKTGNLRNALISDGQQVLAIAREESATAEFAVMPPGDAELLAAVALATARRADPATTLEILTAILAQPVERDQS